MTNTYHVDDAGVTRRCVAQPGTCKYGVHGSTVAEAQAGYEDFMRDSTVPESHHRESSVAKVHSFTSTSYFGDVPPREVQIQALNEVANALQEDDATQLVAACGTGKSYMGRQLLQNEMSKANANGISVILTSSIKLAADTAADLRPDEHGRYDRSMGEYGVDYEVIEVHSGVPQRANELESVRDIKGTIQSSRIQAQLAKAIEEGKKVVIVSTYDSCQKVQEAQADLQDERFAADIIMHDEAHNVLGQQRPTTVASDENVLTAYTGFQNDIPGAIQARKRLYATASPVLRETPGDADPPSTLEDAIAVAEKMAGGDQWARLTYYSDHEMVGKVSGFISQEAAIESGCLARPVYAVRESGMKGRLKDFTDPVVLPDGTLVERSEGGAQPLSPSTYGAIRATLDSLVADPIPGQNGSANALAYVGSIPQAEAFRTHFAEVARAEAGSMNVMSALAHVNSEDEVMRRQARMALLAANAEVKAAHSGSDGESIREKRAAFAMFKGHAVTDDRWHPQRRVLANVDIFSEGISIPEIDTVVIADDEKCTERAMTQAIGRSIRVVPGNHYKTTGHVVIPSVSDESGVRANEASLHLAAYGATRVERALVANKLRGEGVRPDTSTVFNVYGREKKEKLASDFARESVNDVLVLAAAAEAHSAHQYLLRNEPAYRDAAPNEKANMVKSRIFEKSEDPRTPKVDRPRLKAIVEHVRPLTAHEMREERRNARVVTSALSVGDVASLNPSLSEKLISAGVLSPEGEVASVSVQDRRKTLESHVGTIAYALATNPANMSDAHRRLRAALPSELLANKRLTSEAMKYVKTGEASDTVKDLHAAFISGLKNDEFASSVYDFAQEKNDKVLPFVNTKYWTAISQDLEAQEKDRAQRQIVEASAGDTSYKVLETAVRKNGELRSETLRQLFR